MSKKILFTNLVYGRLYADIFLTQHIRSLLDPSNIPACKDRCSYMIFTDAETKDYIAQHPCMVGLTDIIEVRYNIFQWPQAENEQQRFNSRYELLIETFRVGVDFALGENAFLSPMVADLVVAKNYVPQLFHRFATGYDSIFVLPARTAYEPMRKELARVDYALEAKDLWDLAYRNLHPLWVHCHWDNPQFTRLPYSLIWNTQTGLFVRSFSITPIAFLPRPEMLKATQVIDVEVPAMVKNPFWATDWIDCPVIGVEPLFCYYPPYRNERAHQNNIKEWMKKGIHESQKRWLPKELYYPDLPTVNPDKETRVRSNRVVISILEES